MDTSRFENTSPLIFQYLKKYQSDPKSRIFAPLAEAYRKTGLIDEAIEIAREGLGVHPSFTGGKVALSRALFDKKEYEEVLKTIVPVTRDVPDNLAAQRLCAESNLMLGRIAESLDAYKMLLYFNPQDAETTRIVKELEKDAYKSGTLVVQKRQEALEVEQNTASQQAAMGLGGLKKESGEDPKRVLWIQKIEALQELLKRVQKYQAARRDQSETPFN